MYFWKVTEDEVWRSRNRSGWGAGGIFGQGILSLGEKKRAGGSGSCSDQALRSADCAGRRCAFVYFRKKIGRNFGGTKKPGKGV